MRGVASGAFVICIILLLAGCTGSSDWQPNPTQQVLDVTGRYVASGVAGLGDLEMIVRYVPEGGFFRAELSEPVNGPNGQANSIGVGTIGDLHLILNFDRRLETDYYFEGLVDNTAGSPLEIAGQFIFPDGPPNLPATFVYVGEAPPVEEPED